MARNIEIKASVDDLDALEARVAALATAGPFELGQDDTFYRSIDSRLKLRRFDDGSGELIVYRRADQSGPKTSDYLRAPAAEPATLDAVLAEALGRIGRVVKRRTVYLIGRTRVHLDRVADLGDFVELEVVLDDDEAAEAGVSEARTLMARLGIGAERLVATAYVDCLAAAAVPGPGPGPAPSAPAFSSAPAPAPAPSADQKPGTTEPLNSVSMKRRISSD